MLRTPRRGRAAGLCRPGIAFHRTAVALAHSGNACASWAGSKARTSSSSALGGRPLDRLPALMAEVIARKVDVIVTGSTPGAIAAKNATSTIPIVAAGMGDPVRTGLVASLARPGGNLTGLVPGIRRRTQRQVAGAAAGNRSAAFHRRDDREPGQPMDRDLAKELQAIAPKRHLKVQIIEVREPEALDRAFEQARRTGSGGPGAGRSRLVVHTGGKSRRLPPSTGFLLCTTSRDFVDSGGLMAYGPDFSVMFRRAADYVDKILKGAKPADLPIEQPTQYVLVVNLKTAKALGITIPESILLRADEVIR